MNIALFRITATCFFLSQCIYTLSRDPIKVTDSTLVGQWRIEKITIDGIIDPSFDPEHEDYIILESNGNHTTTDNEFDYKHEGKWSLENESVLVLTSDEENDTQRMEILSLENNNMRLKLLDSDSNIIIYLVKYDGVL